MSSLLIILISTAIFAYFFLIIRNMIVKRCSSTSKIETENAKVNETAHNITDANRSKERVTNTSDLYQQNKRLELDVAANASISSNAGEVDFKQRRRLSRNIQF